jgi:hypothetical protein
MKAIGNPRAPISEHGSSFPALLLRVAVVGFLAGVVVMILVHMFSPHG